MPQAPPKHLSSASKDFYKAIADTYILEPHHFRLLTLACEASDRCDEARQVLESEGLFINDRYGTQRAHPAAAIERDSRLAAARLIRELNLDADKPDESRPPGLRYIQGQGG